MKVRIPFLILSALALQACARGPIATMTAPKDKLPSLGLDKSSVTVSGISSGAFMAVQLGVAYSDQIHGVAPMAGGVYGCALGDTGTATGLCMKTPGKINVSTYKNLVKENAKKKLIADPSNIAKQKVFILQGTEDKVVDPAAGPKLAEFYKAFGVQAKTDFKIKMGHGVPSDAGKNKCEVSMLPWVNKCEYEAAGKIFETMYGSVKKPAAGKTAKDLQGELLKFDQKDFITDEAKMLSFGHVYIPNACRSEGSGCRLHIALHGCVQAPNLVGEAFVQDANYNLWADENKIVVLYPATTSSLKNPNGCWDWMGYTNGNYAVRSAPQMTAIMKMVETLIGKAKP